MLQRRLNSIQGYAHVTLNTRGCQMFIGVSGGGSVSLPAVNAALIVYVQGVTVVYKTRLVKEWTSEQTEEKNDCQQCQCQQRAIGREGCRSPKREQ